MKVNDIGSQHADYINHVSCSVTYHRNFGSRDLIVFNFGVHHKYIKVSVTQYYCSVITIAELYSYYLQMQPVVMLIDTRIVI